MTELRAFLQRLCEMATENYYNPYRTFSWSETLPDDTLWMTADLLSVCGTSAASQIEPSTLQRLSKWESINFYSLNVHGIRELLIEVVKRVQMPGFEDFSEFFHHFIGEENEHMWFFAEFCNRYGGKIYPSVGLKTATSGDMSIEHFLVFARILLFEEIVDFYNQRMAGDNTLHEMIRQVNRIHHQDESRHIAFGRRVVSLLYHKIGDEMRAAKKRELEAYLKSYITFSLRSLYSPSVYSDAGIPNPHQFRNEILNSASRRKYEWDAVKKIVSFFVNSGIFQDPVLPGFSTPSQEI